MSDVLPAVQKDVQYPSAWFNHEENNINNVKIKPTLVIPAYLG